MKRSLMQAYVVGSNKAVELYLKAFDAKLVSSYKNNDGTYSHSEIEIGGEVLAVSERNGDYAIKGTTATGNVMQFCLQFCAGNEEKLKMAYEVLSENATVLMPLAPVDYSPLMCDLIDSYGIRWCLFL